MLPRRHFVTGLAASVLVSPSATHAQPASKTAPRIGYLNLYPITPASSPALAGFLRGLRDAGYVEGRTIVVEYRDGGGRAERLVEKALELVALKVAVILAYGGTDVQAAIKATSTIPIVMVNVADPVRQGFIKSLARPGGNVTGVTASVADLTAKRLELLKEVRPGLARVAVLWDRALGPAGPTESARPGHQAAASLGITLQPLAVRQAEDLGPAFEAARRERAGAVMVGPDTLFLRTNLPRISALAAKHRLPTIGDVDLYAEGGLLMSHGPDVPDLARRAATYVDKILKGAKPAELPVEQPTRFSLVVNLKTAKSLELTLPPSLVARADRVIK